MMYQDKFVAVLKVGSQIVREDKDTVLLPFGSEYAIYMKNLEGRTAVVSISLDGQDVLDGNELVLRPNTATLLEGFMKGASVEAKFKFIQKTAQIQEHRGDRIDDGLLRISFKFEKPRPIPKYESQYRSLGRAGGQHVNSGSWSDQGQATMDWCDNSRGIDASLSSFASKGISTPKPEEGITVKGSDSSQKFTATTVGELETEEHVIVMKLMGVNPETAQPVEQLVTVATKKKCTSCGTTGESSDKFCSKCGTRL